MVKECEIPTASQKAGLRVQAPQIFDEMRYRAVIAQTADKIWQRSIPSPRPA